MALELESHGYKILGILWRYQRKRKKKNGKKAGFYERKSYAYVRVRMPDGKKRDFYLGRPDRPAVPQKRGGQAGPRAPSSPAPALGWRKGVEKAARGDGDTRDPYDDRTLSLWKPEPWRAKK